MVDEYGHANEFESVLYPRHLWSIDKKKSQLALGIWHQEIQVAPEDVH
jgi:hypothetical protein